MRTCLLYRRELPQSDRTAENASVKETHGGRRKPMKEVPIWEKSNLSLEEAAAYSGIGIN